MSHAEKRKRVDEESDAPPPSAPPTHHNPSRRFHINLLQIRSISVTVDPSRLLSSLADLAFADEPDKLRPFLRLAYGPEGETVDMEHVIDAVKLDSVTIASFIRLFPVDFAFHVVALVNIHYPYSTSPVPILLTHSTTVDDVKEEYLRVWKLRQLIAADKPYKVELYHDSERQRAVTTSGRGSFFVTWTVEGLAPTLYARVTDPLSLSSSALSSSSSSSLPSSAAPTPHPPTNRVAAPPSSSPASSSPHPTVAAAAAAPSPPPPPHTVGPASIFHIFVKQGTRLLDELYITDSVRVEQVKRLLEARERIPALDQTLLHQGQAMEDSRTLGSYGVKEESELHLMVRRGPGLGRAPSIISVFKPLELKVWALRITASFTGADLKLLIQDQEEIPASEQTLVFKDRRVEDDDNLVRCGVRANNVSIFFLNVTNPALY
jgi:hypothetical protein